MLIKFENDDIYSIESLYLNKLYFSNPCDFNDPYDIPEISISTSRSTELERCLEIFQKDYPDIYYDNIEKINGYNPSQSHEINIICDILTNSFLKSKFRVFCFSKFNNNSTKNFLPGGPNAILMLSHYTNSGKGLAIQYKNTIINQFKNNNNLIYIDKLEYKGLQNFPYKLDSQDVINLLKCNTNYKDTVLRKKNRCMEIRERS